MTSEIENRSGEKGGGFIQIIILVVVALLVMKYYGVTISGVIEWFSSFFGSVFK